MQRVWSTYLEPKHHRGQSSGQSDLRGRNPSQQRDNSDGEPEPRSRPDSAGSNANSSYSHSSTRHLLPDMNQSLHRPAQPFASATSLSINGSTSPLLRDSGTPTSLSVNYLPSKFSSKVLQPGTRLRRIKGDPLFPKRGGGAEAFRSGEARMPGANDHDYDGVDFGKSHKGRLHWNRFKWILFVTNFLLTIYSLVALVFCLLVWFNTFTHADVVRVSNTLELIISTVAAGLGLFTCLFGWAGILLNNRMFLAIYTFLLWAVFAFMLTPGYITYKKKTFNLEGKMNAQWSKVLGTSGRLRIQNRLACCGYFNPFVEATVSQTCYARSILPGCKKKLIVLQRDILQKWYIAAFGLVPLHLGVMFAGLLCSNNVTYRFGKGMMPKAYRLSEHSMAVIMENYANQLAEQYGSEVATEILNRSRSTLNVNDSAASPYPPSPLGTGSYMDDKYDYSAPPRTHDGGY